MPNRLVLLAAALLLAALLPPAAASAQTPDEFTHRATVGGPFPAGKSFRIDLPDAVFRAGRPGLPDLRLLAPDGGECRYVIVEHAIPGEGERTYALPVESFDPGDDAVTITAKIPAGADPLESIDLSIAERDFRKRAKVEALSGGAWIEVADGVVYDFSSQIDLRHLRINLPGVTGEKLRVTLVDDDPAGPAGAGSQISLKFDGLDFSATRAAKKRLRVDGITARAAVRRAGETLYDETVHPLDGVALVPEGTGERALLLAHHLPLDELRFAVDSAEFVRTVRVLAAEKPEGPFAEIGRGSLARTSLTGRPESRDTIRARSPRAGHLKIVFEDRNSPPLALRSVTARRVRRTLLFVPDRDLPELTLCVGHPRLTAPAYDLATIIHQGNWHQGRAWESVALPPLSANAAPKLPASDDDRRAAERALLIAVILLLTAGLGFWLYKVIQATPPPPGGEAESAGGK